MEPIEIVIIGDEATGKTNVFRTICNENPNKEIQPTHAVNSRILMKEVNG
jgi:DNA transposition AAA+ family ATPase